MTRITIKKAGIKPSLYKKIKDHAMTSLYRMNGRFDVYAFDIIEEGNSWAGGWGWLDHTTDWDGSLGISLRDGKLYELQSQGM